MTNFDKIAERISPEQLAAALGARHAPGEGYHCPMHGHEDRNPSCEIKRSEGRTVTCCHGCDLKGSPVQVAARVWDVDEPEAGRRLAERIGIAAGNGRREVETYDYTDEAGERLFQVVRYEPKAFRQRRPWPDGRDGWSWKLGDVRRVLYRLPSVLEAVAAGATVYVVEGERDVHALGDTGVVATTCPMGAGKWQPEYSESLAGARVIVVADKDDAGIAHAWRVSAALEGVAGSVSVVQPRSGKDAADHLAAGHRLDEFEPAPPASIKVPYALLYDTRLTGTAKLVYTVIASCAHDKGGVSRQTVAALVGRSTSTVDRARYLLRRYGWLDWTRHRRAACRYTLHQKPARTVAERVLESSPVTSQGKVLESSPVASQETLESSPVASQESLSRHHRYPSSYSREVSDGSSALSDSSPVATQESPLDSPPTTTPGSPEPLSCAICGNAGRWQEGLCPSCRREVAP